VSYLDLVRFIQPYYCIPIVPSSDRPFPFTRGLYCKLYHYCNATASLYDVGSAWKEVPHSRRHAVCRMVFWEQVLVFSSDGTRTHLRRYPHISVRYSKVILYRPSRNCANEGCAFSRLIILRKRLHELTRVPTVFQNVCQDAYTPLVLCLAPR